VPSRQAGGRAWPPLRKIPLKPSPAWP